MWSTFWGLEWSAGALYLLSPQAPQNSPLLNRPVAMACPRSRTRARSPDSCSRVAVASTNRAAAKRWQRERVDNRRASFMGNLASLVAQRLKHSAWNEGDPGSIPELGRSPGEGNGNPLQYSCLENPVEGGAWWAAVHGVAKSRTRLSRGPV